MSRGRIFIFELDFDETEWNYLCEMHNNGLCDYFIGYVVNRTTIHGYIRFSNARYLNAIKSLLHNKAKVMVSKTELTEFKTAIGISPYYESGFFKCKKNEIAEENKKLSDKNKDLEEENSVITTVLRQNQDVLNNFIDAYKAAKDNDAEQMKQIMELCITIAKNTPTTTNIINATNTNNNTNNNNNNSFNLNFFLNEQCKDAMDIFEFIRGIHINLDDVMMFKNVSHAEGVTRIFDKAYKDVELQKRPIHCTDVKRETLTCVTKTNG